MSEVEKNAKFNATAMLEHAQLVADDVDEADYDSALATLESVLVYAGRLMKDLEDLS